MKKLIYQHQDLLLISLLVLAFALDYFLAIEQWMLIFVVLAIILIGKAVCENVEPEMIALKKCKKLSWKSKKYRAN